MKAVAEELAIWRDQGLVLPLWWRDDDAIEPTTVLDRLLALADAFDAPLHLAVVPQFAAQGLADRLERASNVSVMPHGFAHRNHAPAGEKKAEFGAHRPVRAMLDDIDKGWRGLQTLFPTRALPVFTPPWNRMSDEIFGELPALGLQAVSTYGPRKSTFAAAGLRQVNTHVDPIAWHGGGGLTDEDTLTKTIAALLADRRLGVTDNAEPLGLLTHHLVHREDVWSFTERFLEIMAESGVARWMPPLPAEPAVGSVRT